ncbi:MAG TPA: hypothetical protein VGM43_05100 [Bryobacteraceae bacterium]|jgi:hypothetical protein
MIRGLSRWNTDVALSKSFKLTKEGMSMQFHSDAYNVFNHESFSSPSLGLASPTTFGAITSSATSQCVLQVAARLEFQQ